MTAADPTAVRPGSAALVVLAAGSGTRMGAARSTPDADRDATSGTTPDVAGGSAATTAGRTKAYLPLAGLPVVSWSLRWAGEVAEVGPVLLVIRPEDGGEAAEAVAAAALDRPVEVVAGGATRHRSEQAALEHLASRIRDGSIGVVAVHDGARPLAGADLLRRVVVEAARHGGAVPTFAETGAWLLGAEGRLRLPDARHALHRVQTPQAFRAGPLLDAYSRTRSPEDGAPDGTGDGAQVPDTSAVLEGHPELRVVAVPGSPDNLKITFARDLAAAESALRARL